jgi:epoxyqueuosine reductase QueG
MNDLKRVVEQALTHFIKNDAGNALADHHRMKIYDAPLLGCAAADDAYFNVFKSDDVVSPNFLLPQEWLPGAKTVISYFMPFAQEIRESNRPVGLPSEEWVSARIDGETFNNAVRTYLVNLLEELGASAVAPVNDAKFTINKNISNWSERHVAFAAGLGTFGLHRALITAKGTAGRLGSVVTTLELKPTARPYTRLNEYCLYFENGTCGACIRRCPPAAISQSGKDNRLCSDYINSQILPKFAPRYGCGKCNTLVPCEFRLPVRALHI